LLESEAKYRELANSMPNIVYESDTTGKVDYINDRALEIAGISKEDFKKGLNIMQFLAPEDRQRAAKGMQRLFEGGSYVPTEYLFLRKDGTTFPALIATTLRISKYKVTGLRGLVIDITERKKAEETVRKSERRYRELANLLPEIVFEADLTGKINFFSQRAIEITGFTKEDLEKGLNMLSFVVPEERERAKENMKKSLSGEGLEGNEYTLYKKNGATYPAIVKTTSIASENKVTGLRGLVIDITERKLAEQKLLAASLYSRSLFEASLDPLITISKEGKITDVNKATEEVTGSCREELIGSDFSDYFTDPEDAKAGIHKVFSENLVKDYPLTIKHKSGRLTDVLYNASIYHNPQGEIQGAFAAARDVTESKRGKDALKQEQEKLEKVTENIGAGLTLISKDYRILWANNYLKKLNGPLENKTCFSTFNEKNNICPDCGVQKVFNGAVSDSREYFNRKLSEKGLPCWFEIIATPVKDRNGTTVAVLELTVDITEKKLMQNQLFEYSQKLEKLVDEKTEQLRQTQVKLVNSERLAAIGQLAGMVGHGIRNPLTGIKNAAYFLRKKQASFIGEGGDEMLTIIDKSVGRANKIVNDLLEYSRELHLDLDEYSPKSLIDYLLLAIKVPSNIKVSGFNQDVPSIWVDQDKIERVFINLVNNAFEAMPTGGTLEIKSCQMGEYVEFTFADTGDGMSEDVLSRIFTPLFTTKAQGMGFGLAICKRIVEAHGGKISVKSSPKKGTTFTVLLPIDQKQNVFEKKKEE
jgi:PAS domain S-box-containing protein